MIIAYLKVENKTSEFTSTVREPDPDWRYMRDDAMQVRWHNEGDHWHIPYLVRCSRLEKPVYDEGGELVNDFEFEEYWIDPIDGEEVKPGYVTREKTTRVAGINHVDCRAILTADECFWLWPEDPLRRPDEYKKTLVVSWMGAKFLLTGAWLSEKGKSTDGIFECTLSVDKVDLVE